jgi:glucosamine-6-phosphate deaminase
VTEVRIFDDSLALGDALADLVLEAFTRADGSFLLGCPGGRSLVTTYAALARKGQDFSRLVVVMMDEYLGAPADAHYSCHAFANRHLIRPLGLREDQVWLPDEAAPEAYDKRIREAGGVDLFLLASGTSDGHVAFVPPGTPRERGTAVVALAETTRRDNLATFPAFRTLADVPTHGVSVGLGTIAAARSLRLVLHGAEKRAAAARLLELDAFDPAWPASIVYEHADAEIWLDRAAHP